MYKKYCRTGPILILLCQNFSIISSCSIWESSVSRILRRALHFFLEGFPRQISLFIRYLMCPPGTVTPIFWLSLASKPSWWYLVSYREKFPCRLRYPRGATFTWQLWRLNSETATRFFNFWFSFSLFTQRVMKMKMMMKKKMKEKMRRNQVLITYKKRT